MKPTQKPVRKSIVVEPLEARIAPATISIGAQGGQETSRDTEYHETGAPRPVGYNLLNFTDTSNSADFISLAVDDAPVGSPNNGAFGFTEDTYFLRLSAGDVVERISLANQYKPFITVKTGHVIAYFTDKNHNNEFDNDELTGLSLGVGAAVEVNGQVSGDIATNLNEHKTRDTADDTVDMAGIVSPKQGIASVRVLGGDIQGSIYSGGDIKAVFVAGNVENIFAGSAVEGGAFDFFGGSNFFDPSLGVAGEAVVTTLGGKGIFHFSPAPGQVGANISNATADSVTGVIQAGDGGAGAKAGSLKTITINKDSDGFALLAGRGGDGDSASKKLNGGLGGSITGVYILGTTDDSANSTNGVVIRAGDGGDGLSTAKGGAGGALSQVYVGFELTPSGRVESAKLNADSVFLSSGAGGTGKTGGAGGLLSDSKVRVRTPDVNGVELAAIAGDGGSSLSPTGRSGKGGSVKTLDLRNQSITLGTDILVQAGRGGSTAGAGIGLAGGSVADLQLLSYESQVVAGNGSDGKVGGLGGSITNIFFKNDSNVIPNSLLIDAGRGGTGFGGAGGNAGDISGIKVPIADLASFLINTGTNGNGGDSLGNGGITGKKGGRGSSLTNIFVDDDDSDSQNNAVAEVRAGQGGAGDKGGGLGGSITGFNFTATDITFIVNAGDGGAATMVGKGGAGGAILSSLFVSTGMAAGVDVSGNVESGQGGDGKGLRGAGGAGGQIKTLQLTLPGDGTVRAGDGGSGENTVGTVLGGAAGAGGGITAVGVFSNGSGTMRAGDAGINGVKAGKGGSILGESTSLTAPPVTINGVHADDAITIVAGAGSHGGAGGDIFGISYGSTQQDLTPTPGGAILIQAGNGSSEGKVGGKGGSITRMDGSVSSGLGLTTLFIAGDGGGGLGVAKGGAGGSVGGITIARGGAVGGELRVKAGDAGDSPLGVKGAIGGSIKGFDVTDIDAATIFRSVAAGDGGDALKAGGLGGSVTAVHVQAHDIGIRTGVAYGFDTMGGVFAGVGGKASAITGKAGLNGSVIDVGADAISTIVAGRVGAPQLVEKAAFINLNGGFESLLYNLNGIFPASGAFKLTYPGGPPTNLLASGATAMEVQNELNLLPGIIALGGVTVTSTRTAGYQIQFNNPGNQSAVTGIEQLLLKVQETVPGSTVPFTITETKAGIVNLPVTETRTGGGFFDTAETVPGFKFLNSIEQTSGDGIAVSEVQLIDTSYLATFPTGVFVLSFEGETTGPLSANATAMDIESALNLLGTINNVLGVDVIVSTSGVSRFLIEFGSVDPQNPISGTFFVTETQHLDLSTLIAIPGSAFELTYEGETTPPLLANSNALEIQDALNALFTVTFDGPVLVTGTGGIYDITFAQNGDRNPINVTSQVKEIQTVAVGAFAAEPDGELYLTYGTQVSSALPVNATPAQVDAALEALPAIGLGGVSVVVGPNNSLIITFENPGQQQELVAQGKVSEHQILDLSAYTNSTSSEFTLTTSTLADVSEQTRGSSIVLPTATVRPGIVENLLALTTNTGAAGSPESQYLEIVSLSFNPLAEFYLDFGGARTPFMPVGTSPFQVETELNKLGADVVVNSQAFGSYAVAFNQNGNQGQIIGKAGIREIQTLTTAPLTGITRAEFTLAAGTGVTAPLAAAATRLQIQDALLGLNSLAAVGGITLSAGVGLSSYVITAKDFGNMPNITGEGGGVVQRESQILQLTPFAAIPNTFFELGFLGQTSGPLPVTSTSAQIQAALNALVTVEGLRVDNNGAVVVTVPDPLKPNDFRVTFNIFGDQTPVTVELFTDDPTGPNITVETTPGTQIPLTTTITRQGSAADITGTTTAAGTVATAEVQHLVLGALAGNAQAEFYLTDGIFKTDLLAGNATAADIEAALLAEGVTADVGNPAPGEFDITYLALGDMPQITGKIGFRETTNLDTSAISAIIGAEYTVKAGTGVTIPLTTATTDVQLDAALDALASLNATGDVTVASTGLATFSIVANDIGDMPDLVANGGGLATAEVQTLKLGQYAATPNTTFTLTFNGGTTAILPINATLIQVGMALNALTSVKNTRADGTGVVTVTADPLNPTDYQLKFNIFGNQSEVSSILTSDYFFARQLDTEIIQGSDIKLATATTLQGTVDNILAATATQGAPGGPGIFEVQTLQFASGALSNNPQAEFYLVVNGVRTPFLPVAATVGAVKAAIDLRLLPAGAPPVAQTVTVTGAPGNYIVTFNQNNNKAQITGKLGIRETQTLNVNPLVAVPGAEYILSASGDISVPFLANATAAQIATAINTATANASTLPTIHAFSGIVAPPAPSAPVPNGIVVTSPAANIFNIRAGDFGDMPDILARGGGTAQHQVHDLDLSKFFTAPSTFFAVTFNGETTSALPVGATNTQIQTAINALASVQALRTGNTGMVTVTIPNALAPHDFRVELNMFGDQTPLISAMVGIDAVHPLLSNGVTARLPYNATPAQVEAAIEVVNLVDVTVLAGTAPGLYEVIFDQKGDQPLMSGIIYTHEVQTVDPYTVGDFFMTFGGVATPRLVPNSSPALVEAAIEALPNFLAVAEGGVSVTLNPDSSYRIVFDGDDNKLAFSGLQFETFTTATLQQGSAGLVEVQTLTPIIKGEFLLSAYQAASLVGAIVDITEIDSNVFTFLHNGILTKANPLASIVFVLGDTPVDGILMAKNFDQKTCNFTPEASLTGAGFFDNDNIIS